MRPGICIGLWLAMFTATSLPAAEVTENLVTDGGMEQWRTTGPDAFVQVGACAGVGLNDGDVYRVTRVTYDIDATALQAMMTVDAVRVYRDAGYIYGGYEEE